MRDSVPSPRYSSICNVLRQWKTSLIPTYRVYHSMITLPGSGSVHVLCMILESHINIKSGAPYNYTRLAI